MLKIHLLINFIAISVSIVMILLNYARKMMVRISLYVFVFLKLYL